MTLADLRTRKEKLIREYMTLQDQVDALNERVYQICCEIEATNQLIQQEEKRMKAKPPGKSPATG